MKSITISAVVAALSISTVSAFPAIALEAAAKAASRSTNEASIAQAAKAAHAKRVLGIAPGFDADAQRISVTGDNAFVAPDFDAGDLRGPCPGLNALANHNYLPHDGFATIEQFVSATNEVFGMGVDLGTFLAVYGTVMDGNPLGLTPGWSIGGTTNLAAAQNIGAGLLGVPDGISGSHNKYETDASPTRGDLYQFGNDYALQVSQFQSLFELQPDASTANYDLDVMAQERKISFERSVANNPHFFYGPFTGVEVSNAAHTFIYRFMSNKSAENPEGVLDQETLKSFFAISGESGSFTVTPGHERIPENWYKRAIGDEYSIPFFELDILYLAAQYPNSIAVGGNTGTTNSFTGVDFSDLTGGVFNATTLLEGNNLACFTYQAAALLAPDILDTLYSDISQVLSTLTTATSNALADFTCPQLEALDLDQLKQFPGYTGGSTDTKRR